MASKKRVRQKGSSVQASASLHSTTAQHEAAQSALLPARAGQRPDAAAVMHPTNLLHLQRTLGNRVVQRMIQVGSNLYYNAESISTKLPGKKKTELKEWQANLGSLTGKTIVNLDTAYAIPGAQFTSPVVGDALTAKLKQEAQIFKYPAVGAMNQFVEQLRGGNPEDIEPFLHPKDMLDEKRDLSMKYDPGKACVLQALINLGVKHPDLTEGQQSDPIEWHTHYIKQNIMYDDDSVIYRIYSDLGLRMAWNKRMKWSALDPRVIEPGEYVFSTPGHNFAVIVHDSDNPAERYEPKDAPQNIVSSYEPDRIITYAWRKA